MKEAPKFEFMLFRLLRQPGVYWKLLIGGLLSFVPVLNFFAFGYLYRTGSLCRRQAVPVLPDWDNPIGLLRDGFRFTLVWLVCWLIPVLLILLLSCFLNWLHLGALGHCLNAAAMIGFSLFFCAALYRFQRNMDLRDLLDVMLLFRMVQGLLRHLPVAALATFGLVSICWPLYGFAFFFGFLLLILQSFLFLHSVEASAAASRAI